MLLALLSHQWKETRRSSVFRKSVALNIILGLLILYFGLIFISLGAYIDKFLLSVFPNQSPIDSFNGFLLFYFLVDLFMRFLLQELPVLAIQPYLHLPIRKGKLIHFVLLKSIPNFYNTVMLLVFVPFVLKVLVPVHGYGASYAWLAAMILVTLFNNYILIYFKRQLSSNPKLTLLFALFVAGLMVLDYANVLSLRQTSTTMFGALLLQPWLVVIPAVMLAIAYSINYRFLLTHTYPEEISIKKVSAVKGGDIAFLNRFGEIGKLITLELKLIWRHKRSKSLLTLSAFFLLYGLIFYTNKNYMDGFGMLIFVGIFTTGMFMFNYGQFLPSWQSGHFDALLTKQISPYRFYQAKFWLLVPSVGIAFLLSLPYAYFGYKVVLINLAALLFNIGINVFVIFYFSVTNKSRLDLSKGSAFNWQGVGASKFVVQLPLFLLPLLIYAPFGFLDIPYWGIFTIGFAGLMGFVFHRQLLGQVAKRFTEHKYKLAAGYRQS